jgi:hypothetical protein
VVACLNGFVAVQAVPRAVQVACVGIAIPPDALWLT